ncbi:MAG: hypothetical protein KC994_12615, partial [Candidatus Omnitrophica bacterium]|nr:hypothetical protein [Candidatus Omnitrophota bacterium]
MKKKPDNQREEKEALHFEMLNDLASFLDERVTDGEHARILKEIVESPDAQGIVLDVLSEEETELSASNPPIPIQAKIEVHVCGSFFQPNRTQNAKVIYPFSRLGVFLQESFGERLQICFSDKISYEISLGSISGEITLQA